jgi:MFS family permease
MFMRSGSSSTLVVLVAAGVDFAVIQSFSIPALATFQREFGSSTASTAWILTAFLLAAAATTPVIGRLGDLLGHKRVLLAVLSVAAVGSLVSALATSLPPMVLGRALQGPAVSIFPLAFGILRHQLHGSIQASALGRMSVVMASGGLAGFALSGPVTHYLSYHALFWIPLAALLVTIPAVALVVPSADARGGGGVNWIAAVLLGGWLVAVLLAITKGSLWGWTSAATLGLVAAALVMALCWVLVELRSRGPLVDLRLMRSRPMWTTNAATFLTHVGWFELWLLVPLLLQLPRSSGQGFGWSTSHVGLVFVPAMFSMLVSGVVAERLARAFETRIVFALGALVECAGFALLAIDRAATWEIYVASATMGGGLGLCLCAIASAIVDGVPAEQTSVATGVNTITRSLGGAFGTQIGAVILAASAASGLPSNGGYGAAFLFGAVATLAGVAVALGIPRRSG